MLIAAAVLDDVLRGVLQGVPPGSVYAIIAVGFVLAYKTSGVFNLAFGAQAFVSAALFFHARTAWGWPSWLAFVVSVVVVAPAIGVVLERLVFRHLPTDAALAKLVITIGLSVALPSLFELIVGFEPVAGRTPEGLLPGGAEVFYDVAGIYSFSRNELTSMVIAVVAVAGLGALFRFSPLGLQMRATVESPRLTELAGVRSDGVAAFAWALSSLFAGLAGVLIAPRFNTLAAPDFFNLVVVAVTAAALGRLVDLPRALVGGVSLGITISLVQTFLPRVAEHAAWLTPIQENVTSAIPFLALFALVLGSRTLRSGRDHVDPLSGVSPPPPPPAAMSRSPLLTRATLIAGVVFFAVVGLVVFTSADAQWMFLVTQTVILSIVFLSVTVITGFAGQISLCQGAFAAIGGFTVFQLADRFDVNVMAAVFVGAAIAAAVAALLAVPLVRLGRVWVAIATLAFAAFFDAVVVKLPFVGGGATSLLQGTRVPRPAIGPVDLGADRHLLAVALVVLGITALAVRRLRDGTTGRMLAAVRASELAGQSIGISATRSGVTAFAISGFVAGLGGGLLSIQQQNVNYATNFSPYAALFWVVVVVSLGVRTVEGASHAAAGFALTDPLLFSGVLLAWMLRSPDSVPDVFPLSPKWRFVMFGLGTIAFAKHPEGLVENGKRTAHRRVEQLLARRRSAPGGAPPSGSNTALARPHPPSAAAEASP